MSKTQAAPVQASPVQAASGGSKPSPRVKMTFVSIFSRVAINLSREKISGVAEMGKVLGFQTNWE
jgi:ribosomal protein S14